MIKGKIVLEDKREMNIELYDDIAPISVKNFVKLAKEGYYKGLIFHRVIPNFMIQGGGFERNLEQKGGAKEIKGEFKTNGVENNLKHTAGVLSMARTMVKDSATSQFFICVTDTPHLDGQYAGFGKCCDAQSVQVAIDISGVQTTSVQYYQDVPVVPVVIEDVIIED